MKNWNLFIFIVFLSTGGFAHALSAHRKPGQSYSELRPRHLLDWSGGQDAPSQPPESLQVPLEKLDLSKVPALTDENVLQEAFSYIRDTRFITPSDNPFQRRITWLYPDDGCFARAELMAQYLVDHNLPPPAKVFVFGDLQVKTPNSPMGYATWWYHVATAYRTPTGVLIFDPSVEPKNPLPFTVWASQIGAVNGSAGFAICSSHTFDPDADCLAPETITRERALNEQTAFLDPEWERLQSMGRNPQEELGDKPPWLPHAL